MLNQKHNVFKGQKSKSKIFITILCIFGLLFSWSCSCRNNVTGPGNDGLEDGKEKITNVDPGTFSISGATGNVVASIVQSAKTVGDIKIAFAEANNHDYTMDYTVDDANETVEANKIDKTNFQVVNNVLTASESLLNKVRALNTDNGPAEKTITINFTFTATDKNLKNNTQTLSVEVKLTHAQKVDDNANKSLIDYIVKVFKTSSEKPFIVGYDNDSTLLEYPLNEAVNNNEKLEFKATTNNEDAKTFSKIEVKRKIINGLNKELKNHGVKETVQSDTNLATVTTDGHLSFKVKLTFEDTYEAESSEVEIIIQKASYNNTWEDTERPE